VRKTDVADRRGQRAGSRHVDAGDRHQPPNITVENGQAGDDPVDGRELLTEEVQLAQAPVDSETLIERQLLSGQPLASYRRIGVPPLRWTAGV
jgi:hypothetical protein